MKHLIVGVDPGTTTGIAALDFDGNLVALTSSKNLGLNKTIDYIISLGKPSLIASDVNPAPGLLVTLSSKLGSPLYEPTQSLSVDDKIKHTRIFQISDAHQRDALAAALTAYQSYKNKFQKIASMGLGDEVKHLLLQGYSVDDALKKLYTPPQKADSPETLAEEQKKPDEQRRVKQLERQCRALREYVELKDKELSSLRRQLLLAGKTHTLEVKNDRVLVRSETIARNLRKNVSVLQQRLHQFSRLQDAWDRVTSGEFTPVGVYPKSVSGVIVVRKNLTASDLPKLREVQLVFTNIASNKRILSAEGVRVADSSFLSEIDGCFYVPSNVLRNILSERDISIENIVKEYRISR